MHQWSEAESSGRYFFPKHVDSMMNVLMITAGTGRVADFEYLHISDIEKMFTIDTVSTIKIIRQFYERIKSDTPFDCGVIGSIAGLVSSIRE